MSAEVVGTTTVWFQESVDRRAFQPKCFPDEISNLSRIAEARVEYQEVCVAIHLLLEPDDGQRVSCSDLSPCALCKRFSYLTWML